MKNVGRFIIYNTWRLATGNDLFLVPADGGAAIPFATRLDEGPGAIVGRWTMGRLHAESIRPS